jgi:transposase
MATITKKLIGGKPYFYARECKRVNGKPKVVWQKYLGRADDIIAALTQAPAAGVHQPREALLGELGGVLALYDLAQRLRLVQLIDQYVPKLGAGPSVGSYLLVATLNRCLEPCSKASIARWFEQTVLRRLLPLEARQLTSQRFWDNMDRVSVEAIANIERELGATLVREFDLDVRRVLFDATNFFTFIDTFNQRCRLAQRGKSKEGREALRIVGVALLVSADFHVPLLHATYPGNQPDAPTFASLSEALVEHYHTISQGTEHITLVFDKGNNSQDNLDAVASGPYHFIGSLVPTHHPDLLAMPRRRFRSLEADGLPGVSVYRTSKPVFWMTRTVLVTYNENLFVAQTRTLLREIGKRQQRLRQLQQQLRAWRAGTARAGRAPTLQGTKTKVAAWLKARHMKELFEVRVTERAGLPELSYRFDQRAWQRLQSSVLGINILFTDNDDWTDADIVRGYRSQHHVESAFRDMKAHDCIALRPQYHWTDQKIRVHVFCCVLALLLCTLLRRELHRRGIDLSLKEILAELGGIREVGVLFPPDGRKRNPILRTTLSHMSGRQRELYDALDLSRYVAA